MRRAARKDANHAEIVEAMRKAGAGVIDTSGVGGGFPDCLVGYRGRWMLVEIKDGSKPPSAQKKTTAQIAWWEAHAHCGPVALVNDVDGALKALERLS